MVCYSCSLNKHRNIEDVYELIHEGKVSELGFLVLAKNRPRIIVEDGKLGDDRFDYLVALRDGSLPIHCGASFHVESYNPY